MFTCGEGGHPVDSMHEAEVVGLVGALGGGGAAGRDDGGVERTAGEPGGRADAAFVRVVLAAAPVRNALRYSALPLLGKEKFAGQRTGLTAASWMRRWRQSGREWTARSAHRYRPCT